MSSDKEGAELRQHRRVTRKFQIQCRWVGSHAPAREVELRDFSAGGARLHSDFEIAQDAKILLDFEIPSVQLDKSLHAHVMWARLNQTNNEWDWGVRFQDNETYTVQQIFEKLSGIPEEAPEAETAAPSDTAERRAAPRIKESFPIRFTKSPAGWLSSWSMTQALDLSGTGVAFISAVSYDVGAFIELDIQIPEAEGHPRVRGVIARCDSSDDGFRLGVQFVEMDQDSQRYLAGYLSKRLKELLEKG